MIMEKRKGGMRLTECTNNSFSYSQDKQHHQLNDRTWDDRLHYLRTRQLLGMHVSIRLNKKIGALYSGGPRGCSQKVPWKGAVDNCWAAPCWQQREGAEERKFSCIVLSPIVLDRAGEIALDHNRLGRQR